MMFKWKFLGIMIFYSSSIVIGEKIRTYNKFNSPKLYENNGVCCFSSITEFNNIK